MTPEVRKFSLGFYEVLFDRYVDSDGTPCRRRFTVKRDRAGWWVTGSRLRSANSPMFFDGAYRTRADAIAALADRVERELWGT